MDPLQVVLRSALETERAHGRGSAALLRGVVFGWLFMDMARFRLLARAAVAVPAPRRALAGAAPGHPAAAAAWPRPSACCPTLPATFVTPHDETYPHRRVSASAGGVLRGLRHVDRPGRRRSRDDPRPAARRLQRAQPRAAGLLRRAARPRRRPAARAASWRKRNIAAFEQTEGPIVVNSAGCGAMLKDYAHHLRNDPAWAERARDVLGARARPERGAGRPRR